jgi:hypothetical protein
MFRQGCLQPPLIFLALRGSARCSSGNDTSFPSVFRSDAVLPPTSRYLECRFISVGGVYNLVVGGVNISWGGLRECRDLTEQGPNQAPYKRRLSEPVRCRPEPTEYADPHPA